MRNKKILIWGERNPSMILYQILPSLKKIGFKEGILFQSPEAGIQHLRRSTSYMMLIVDHTILLHQDTFKWLNEFKRTRNIPFLFLTADPVTLIQMYSTNLYPYGEMDDFLDIKLPLTLIEEKLKKRIDTLLQLKNIRASKRVPFTLPALLYTMDTNKKEEGHPINIFNLSLHGLGFYTSISSCSLNYGQRALIMFKLSPLYQRRGRDIFKGLVKVRRISLKGDEVGCSWNFLNTEQEQNIRFFIQKTLLIQAQKNTQNTNQLPLVFSG